MDVDRIGVVVGGSDVSLWADRVSLESIHFIERGMVESGVVFEAMA